MARQPVIDPKMLGKIIDSLPFAAFTFDKDRCVLYSNTAAQKMQKAFPGAFLGAAEENHFDENKYLDEEGNAIPTSRPSVIERAFEGKETRELILEHRKTKTRTHSWIEVNCVPVMDKRGEFSYGIITYRDVSARKKQEDKYNFLVESTKILSITMDFESRLQKKAALAVPSLADWCAIDIVNAQGEIERKALVHRDPEKIEWLKEYERKYPVKSGQESATARVVRTGNGEYVPIVTQEMIATAEDLTSEQRKEVEMLKLSSIMILPIRSANEVLGTLTLAYAESGRTYAESDYEFFREFARHLGVLLDNARLYNEIHTRDQAKDIFLASLSHELRNPIAPIRTSLELLQMQNRDSDFAQELNVIEHQFGHMTRLLNDLLDATRFASGKINVHVAPLDLKSVVQQVIEATRHVAENKGVLLSFSSEVPSCTVEGDRTRLEQALTNIISNGIKFTPEGGRVTVTLFAEDGKAIIRVTDTGTGITSDELRHVFEPYYQSERLRNGNSGLGIGLRLVYEIMRLHHGSIQAASEGIDKGSLFTITLPTVESAILKNRMPATANLTSAKKIVIVDDNAAAADGLARLLTLLGWNAVALYSGPEFLKHLSGHPVDIALVDIGMPDMDGYEVIQEARSGGHKLPIIALTGYGLETDRIKAIAAGFSAHLTKPVGIQDLKTTFSQLL
jgi:signal transduction histidine kinase/CheY-like chemotaxis protein